MRKLKYIVLLLILTMITSSVSFATPSQVKYSDNDLFELAQNNLFINNDSVKVRKAMPDEVSVDISDGYKVISEDFIIITEEFPALNGNDQEKEIEVRVMGDIAICDTTEDEPGFRARATSILRAEPRKYPDTTTGYKGITFGGKMESMEVGNSVQKLTCRYNESGPYRTYDGGQGVIGSDPKTATWTTNLFSANTSPAIMKDRYFISSGATQIGNAATFYCTRGTANYTFTINAVVFK